MKRILVTYSNEKYDNAKKYLINSAKKLNYFDEILSFGTDDIEEEFRLCNEEILSIERGNGLWLWKPYFLQKVLNSVEENDIVFYCDSGAFFLKSPQKLEEYFQDIYVVDIPLIEKQFSKKLILEKMEATEEIKNSRQIIATYFIVRKNNFTMELIDEWLELCSCKQLLEPSNDFEEDYFISHREDQSILSTLCKKKGVKPNIDISQRRILQYTYWSKEYIFLKNKVNLRYGIYIYLHKMPEVSLKKIIKHLSYQVLNNFKGNIKRYLLNF